MKESQHTEWKESWRDDHLRWVCGRANAEVGVRFIGRNDKGSVAGISDAGNEGRGTGEVAGEVAGAVTGEVLGLLAVLHGEMEREDIQAALGLKNDEHFRLAYLQPALSAGLIEMTLPGKPTSRQQRYRLTASGHARQQAMNEGDKT